MFNLCCPRSYRNLTGLLGAMLFLWTTKDKASRAIKDKTETGLKTGVSVNGQQAKHIKDAFDLGSAQNKIGYLGGGNFGAGRGNGTLTPKPGRGKGNKPPPKALTPAEQKKKEAQLAAEAEAKANRKDHLL